MKGRRKIVIAGGGTGGHIVPSLEIARALVKAGYPATSIELFGSRRGQEATLWPTLEFPFILLSGRGIRRSLRPRALIENVGAIAGLIWATLRSVVSFVSDRPRIAVVVGGYAGFSAGFAAVVTKVPLILVNTDAVPGAVNAALGRFATASAVAFSGTDLPRATVTGTPVRPELSTLDRSAAGRRSARQALGLPPARLTIAAFGGSLGARRINAAVAELAQQWRERGEVSIYHVAGRRDFARYSGHATADAGSTGEPAGLDYQVIPFEDRMPELYSAADVVVCRAGAMTVAELMVAGVPAILVPLPGAPRDHQTKNASVLAAAGAAILVPDDQCDGGRLAAEIDQLLGDPDRLEAMGDAARNLGRPSAATNVADMVRANAR